MSPYRFGIEDRRFAASPNGGIYVFDVIPILSWLRISGLYAARDRGIDAETKANA
jgi:hypothetical protein